EREELISLSGRAYEIYELLSPSPGGRRYWDLCIKGWTQVQQRLTTGEFIATGLDPQDRSGRRWHIDTERWPYATVNYETWAVQIYAVTFVGIEVSTVGGLHISETSKKARLGSVDLDLQGRPFDVLLTLAKAVKSQPDAMVTNALLNKKHISGNAGPRE